MALTELQDRYNLLDKKVGEFKIIMAALQNKTIHLLECISQSGSQSGIITREYDELSNDINAVQLVIEKYSTEMEEIKAKMDAKIGAVSNKNLTVPGPNNCNIQPHVTISNSLAGKSVSHSNPTIPMSIPPSKFLLRANLPDNQMTSVEVKPGTSLRQALFKKLANRGLDANTLKVYLKDNCISWDTDAIRVALTGETISVRSTEKKILKNYHQFQKKTFFEKQYCEVCHKFVFIGYCCKICWGVYHVKCSAKTQCVAGDDEVFSGTGDSSGSIGRFKILPPSNSSIDDINTRITRRSFYLRTLCCLGKSPRKKSKKTIKQRDRKISPFFDYTDLSEKASLNDARFRTFSEETAMTNVSVVDDTVSLADRLSNNENEPRKRKTNFVKRSQSALTKFTPVYQRFIDLAESEVSVKSFRSLLSEIDLLTTYSSDSDSLSRLRKISELVHNISNPSVGSSKKFYSCGIPQREIPKIYITNESPFNIPSLWKTKSPSPNIEFYFQSSIDRQLSAPNMQLRSSQYPEYQYLNPLVRLHGMGLQ